MRRRGSTRAGELLPVTLQAADPIESTIDMMRELAKSYEAQMDRLKADNAYLKRENASLWEQLRDAEDAVKELRSMLERQTTELPR